MDVRIGGMLLGIIIEMVIGIIIIYFSSCSNRYANDRFYLWHFY
jgi:hypothetical protein